MYTIRKKGVSMNQHDLKARCDRLLALSKGLAREITLWTAPDALLHFDERQKYLDAISQALRGTESAQVILYRALMGRSPRRTIPPDPLYFGNQNRSDSPGDASFL
jgi:hypothetical protein